jgi:heterodisulfide reductase subunit A
MMTVARHPNIELITCAELTSLKGKAGKFTAKIHVNSRFVDESKCIGCGDCFDVCPVTVEQETGQNGKAHKAIYRSFAQAVPTAVSIMKRGTPPCTAGCPIHQNAQGYVALIAEGRFDEALGVVLRENPLPSICGRICTHPCTNNCTRQQVDDPVNIPILKRFVTDNSDNWEMPPLEQDRSEKVAIVGSGPAGLMCAFILRTKGYRPTIFEAADRPGGMLTVGIPAFRLPRESISHDIQRLVDSGVELKINTAIGKDITLKDLQKDYSATFLGIGAHTERKLNVPGEDLKRVWGGIEFLRQVNRDEPVKLGKRVLIIGGGNSALDAARAALRCGATEAEIVYRRTRAEMPADPLEIAEAEDEGIKLNFLSAPVEVEGSKSKGVTALKCIQMKLGAPDASGRATPKPVPGSEFSIPCDDIIVTIGQSPDLDSLGELLGINTTKWNTFKTDAMTGETDLAGVFAGGDCVTGPDVVVNAMYAGRKAAISIDRYLQGMDLRENRKGEGPHLSEYTVDTAGVLMKRQISVPSVEMDARRTTFSEVHTGYTAEMAQEEAKRCLQCGICCDCERCVAACTKFAIDHSMQDHEREVSVGSVITAVSFHELDSGGRALPSRNAAELAKVLDIEIADSHFHRSQNQQIEILESTRPGILHCGGWLKSTAIPEVIEQAATVAELALKHLPEEARLPHEIPIAITSEVAHAHSNGKCPDLGIDTAWEHEMQVSTGLCRACRTCVDICPYHAPLIVEENGRRVAYINTVKCKACGTCSTWCPTGAIHAVHHSGDQVGDMMDNILEELRA